MSRLHRRDAACRALLSAGGALADDNTLTAERVATALGWIGIALVHVTALDTDGRAVELAAAQLGLATSPAESPEAGDRA